MNDIILSADEGIRALEWIRDREGVGALQVLVSTRAYTNRIDPQWLEVRRVATGATPYPVKCSISDAGEGQWAFREVLAVAVLPGMDLIDEFPFPREG
jgi:ribosomal protein S7